MNNNKGRLGIELHKINKKVFTVLPYNFQVLSRSEISRLNKYVDGFILDTTKHYEKSVGSPCLCPSHFIKYFLDNTANNNEELINKIFIMIDFQGVQFCEKAGEGKLVNSTYFYSKLNDVDKVEFMSSCDEYMFYMNFDCRINFPIVESIEKKIEYIKKINAHIILVNIDHAHPNFLHLF